MRQPGFALVEVVVALLIGTTAIAASYVAFATVLDIRARLDAIASEDIAAAEARRAIAEWLRGAYARPGEAGVRVLTEDEGDLPAGALLFSTSRVRPIQPGAARVALYVDARPETPQRGLVALISDAHSAEPMEVIPSAAQVTVRVLRRADHQWTSVWNSTADLPAAIEVRLAAANGTSMHPLLTVPILVKLEQHQ